MARRPNRSSNRLDSLSANPGNDSVFGISELIPSNPPRDVPSFRVEYHVTEEWCVRIVLPNPGSIASQRRTSSSNDVRRPRDDVRSSPKRPLKPRAGRELHTRKTSERSFARAITAAERLHDFADTTWRTLRIVTMWLWS